MTRRETRASRRIEERKDEDVSMKNGPPVFDVDLEDARMRLIEMTGAKTFAEAIDVATRWRESHEQMRRAKRNEN